MHIITTTTPTASMSKDTSQIIVYEFVLHAYPGKNCTY